MPCSSGEVLSTIDTTIYISYTSTYTSRSIIPSSSNAYCIYAFIFSSTSASTSTAAWTVDLLSRMLDENDNAIYTNIPYLVAVTSSPGSLLNPLLLPYCSSHLMRLRPAKDQVPMDPSLRLLFCLGCALVRIWTLLKRRRQILALALLLFLSRLETRDFSLGLRELELRPQPLVLTI